MVVQWCYNLRMNLTIGFEWCLRTHPNWWDHVNGVDRWDWDYWHHLSQQLEPLVPSDFYE